MTPGSPLHRALRHRSFLIGGVLSLLLIVTAVVSLVWTPWPVTEIAMARKLQGPSAAHWLGTDHLGRDVLSRIIWGARNSIAVGLVAVTLGMAAGVESRVLASQSSPSRLPSTHASPRRKYWCWLEKYSGA